jgi:hypothetical protein
MADNAFVFITGHGPSPSFGRTILQAGSLLAAYVAAALVVAIALFRAHNVN